MISVSIKYHGVLGETRTLFHRVAIGVPRLKSRTLAPPARLTLTLSSFNGRRSNN